MAWYQGLWIGTLKPKATTRGPKGSTANERRPAYPAHRMPVGLVIRAADRADALRIGELDPQWTPILGRGPRFQRAAAKGRLLVAELNGDLVAYAAQGRFFGYDFLELLAVAPDKRRLGIATALIRAVEARSNTGKLFTSTNRSNRPMRRLCVRLGFQPSGVVQNLDNDDPELVYYRRLESAP